MYLLADIGGSKTRITVSKDLESFEDPVIYETPEDYNEAIDKFCTTIQENYEVNEINLGVIGVPGIVRNGKLISLANLPDWDGKNLSEQIKKNLGIEFTIINDAALSALGEAVFGAGKNNSIVAYITISTGIGGARAEDGKISSYSLGFEPGHHIIDIVNNKPLTFEDAASGTAIKNKFDISPEELEGDKLNEITKYISIGLNNVVAFWSPDIIVLGGGIMINKKVTIDMIKEEMKNYFVVNPELPNMKLAELGDYTGLYGAMAALKSSDK